MQCLRLRTTLLASLLGVLSLLVGTFALHTDNTAAQTVTSPLVPIPGMSSVGGGSVSLTPTVGSVQIDLSDARPASGYRVSLCSSSAIASTCSGSGTITTDAGGSFHGAVVTALAHVDLVLLFNSRDQDDAYSALTGPLPEISLPILTTALDDGGVVEEIGILSPSGGTVLFPSGTPIDACQLATSRSGLIVIAPDGTSSVVSFC